MYKRIKKWIIPITIFIIIILYLCTIYETINFVAPFENITHITSPFEDTKNSNTQIRKIVRSLDRIILTEKVAERSTREVVYQVHIHSKGGHTEEIISYGDRLLHYYDGQCLGEYYVPLITRLYLYYIYGGIG